MGQTKSFFEVLEAQIRTDLRQEIEAEVRAEMKRQDASKAGPTPTIGLADRLETWLVTNVTPSFVARRSTYSKKTSSPKPEQPAPPTKPVRSETIVQLTTVRELCALELLSRHAGMKLQTNELSESQFKSMWRRAALKTHPDRFTGEDALVQVQKTALFRELCEAYECLELLFEARAAA